MSHAEVFDADNVYVSLVHTALYYSYTTVLLNNMKYSGAKSFMVNWFCSKLGDFLSLHKALIF